MKIYINTIFLLSLLISITAQASTSIGVQFIVSSRLGSPSHITPEVEKIVADVNHYFSMSGVNISIYATDIIYYPLHSSINSALNNLATNGYSDRDVRTDLYAAAAAGASYLYGLVADEPDPQYCGRAITVNSSVYAIQQTEGVNRVAVSRLSCGSDTVAHELGHLMGLAHGNKIAECIGSVHARALTREAKGWSEGNCDGIRQLYEFGTIMAGNWALNEIGAIKVPVFSNPNVSNFYCGADRVCGDHTNGNAASVLNRYSHEYKRVLFSNTGNEP